MDYSESIRKFSLILESEFDFKAAKNVFFDRQKKHNQNVRDILDKLAVTFPEFESELDSRARSHDSDKFKEPLLSPYVYITATYKDKTIEIDDEMRKRMSDAKFQHVKENEHHPEFWDKALTENPFKSYGKFVKPKIVDGTSMNDASILEMVADWSATGSELGNTARQWFDRVYGKRFKFSPKQSELILKAIKSLEK